MCADLRVDTDVVQQLSDDLKKVKDELNGRTLTINDTVGMVGYRPLAAKLDDVVDGWRIHRKQLVDDLDGMGASLASTAKNFRELEGQLVKAIKSSTVALPAPASLSESGTPRRATAACSATDTYVRAIAVRPRPPATTWLPLADTDPIPGRVADIVLVAKNLVDVANHVNAVAGTLNGIAQTDSWVGASGNEFRASAQTMSGRLSKVYTRYEGAAKALHTYATKLARHQDDSLDLLTKAKVADIPLDQLGALQKRLCQIQVDRDGDGNTANDALDDTLDSSDLNDGWSDEVGDFVRRHAAGIGQIANVAGWIATACGIASLCVGWIPVVGQILAGVLGAVATVASVVAGICHLALALSTGEGWGDVALDAIAIATLGLGRAASGGIRAAGSATGLAARLEGAMARAEPMLAGKGIQLTDYARGLITKGATWPEVAKALGLKGSAANNQMIKRMFTQTWKDSPAVLGNAKGMTMAAGRAAFNEMPKFTVGSAFRALHPASFMRDLAKGKNLFSHEAHGSMITEFDNLLHSGIGPFRIIARLNPISPVAYEDRVIIAGARTVSSDLSNATVGTYRAFRGRVTAVYGSTIVAEIADLGDKSWTDGPGFWKQHDGYWDRYKQSLDGAIR